MNESPNGRRPLPPLWKLGAPARHLVALGLVAAAYGLREGLVASVGPLPPFLTAYPVVTVAAFLLGVGPGLVAMAASALAAWYWILPPQGSFSVGSPSDVAALLVYGGACVVVTAVAVVHHRARGRAAALEQSSAVAAAVSAAQDRLRLAVRAASAGTWEWDLRTNENSWSDELWALYGLAPHSVPPSYEAWRQGIAPEDRAAVERALAESVRGGSEIELNWRTRDPAGRERWLMSRGRPELGPDGTVARYIGVVIEVTAQKRAEQEALEGRAKLEAALSSMTDAVAIVGVDGHFIDHNAAWSRFHRFASWEGGAMTLASARQHIEIFLADGAPAPVEQRPIHRALHGETSTGVEYRLRCRDSGEAWVGSYSFAPIHLAGEMTAAVVVARDVTPQRKAEQALREREALLRLYVENTPAAVAMFDREMRYLAVSRRYLGDYRLGATDLLGQCHYDVFPEIPERWREIHRRCLAGAVERCDEDPFPRQDGTLDWIRWEIHPWRHDGGEIGGIVLFSESVTAAKQAQLALRTTESRYRTMFDHAAVGVTEVETATGRILEANARLCALLGYTQDELAARRWQELTHPDDRATDEASVERMVATGAPYQREKRYLRKDGSTLWASLSVSRLAVPGTAPTTHVAAIVDIHERKQAEEAARRSEERFRALIEKSSDMIQVLDGDGRFRFWSQSAATALGWTPEEVLGRPAAEVVHQEDRPRFAAALESLASSAGSTVREALRFQHKDGSWRHVEVVARSLLDDPAVRGLVLNSRDVTAQRLLEDQFRRAQKLESVGRLAGGVAHDFNNLLTVILGCSESLPSMVEGNEQALLEIEEIRAAGERARDLTGQLLAFARKQVVAPTCLDVNTLVRKSEKMLRRLLGEDVELEVDLQPAPWSIYADRGQVEQVLLNLAVNARDAMPKGGKLVIETRNGAVSGREAGAGDDHQAGDWVQLRVRDTGVGMSPEVRAHLFEPFFTTKEQGKGTGLGLATVYGIVAQAGGHIHVESQPGLGTTFQVCLPRTEGPAVSAPERVQPVSTRGRERVLVVEDDAMVRAVIVRALAGEGYQVTALGHPAQALSLADGELRQAGLLVTDVVMPGLDGHALAEELIRRSPAMRVLYLSGYTRDAIWERGVHDSGLHFLAKPFARTALLTKVREILDAR